MSDHNNFLSNYNKDRAQEPEPETQAEDTEQDALETPETAPDTAEPETAQASVPEEGQEAVAVSVEEADALPEDEAVEGDKAQMSVQEPKAYKYEQKSGFKKPEHRGKGTSATDRKKTNKIIGLAVGGAVVIGLVILLVALLGGGTELPDFTDWTIADVQLWARDNSMLLQTEQAYSDEFAADKIISQDKEAGTRIKRGDFVRVTVSQGPDLSVLLPLPDIMTMTVQEIEKWAADNFMTKVRITTEYNETVPTGHVIRYEINDNTIVDQVRRDTPIYIIASKGSESEVATIEVPDFKIKSLAEAYDFATQNGITLTVREEFDDYVPAGTVISQSVKEKEKVSRGSEIILVISKGKMVTVPDFSGYSKERATAVATGLGIPLTVVERYSGSAVNKFLSQSIAAGTIYETGDYLELNYSLGNKIVVASFVGQTQDAIEAWALELNEKGASIKISVTTTNSSQPKGTILHQDKANSSIGIKNTIRITVSAGAVVYVPDFSSGAGGTYESAVTREKAIAMCEELGLIPVFAQGGNAGALPGAVWAQSIGAGTEVAQGTAITLTFAPTQTRSVPDFTKESPENHKGTFSFKTEYVDDPSGTSGAIVGQSVAAGTTAVMGTTITVYKVP